MHGQITVTELLDLSATVSILALCEAAHHDGVQDRIAWLPSEAAGMLTDLTDQQRLRLAQLARPARQEGDPRSHHWWRWLMGHLRGKDRPESPSPEPPAHDPLRTLATVTMVIELAALVLAARGDAGYMLRGRFDTSTLEILSELSEFERVALAMHLSDQHFGLPSGKPDSWWRGKIACAREHFEIENENGRQRAQLADALRVASMR